MTKWERSPFSKDKEKLYIRVKKLLDDGGINKAQIARELGITYNTLLQVMKEGGQKADNQN